MSVRIFKEKAGVIGEKEVWVALSPGYLYTADTLWQLVKILIFEWENDQHLVG